MGKQSTRANHLKVIHGGKAKMAAKGAKRNSRSPAGADPQAEARRAPRRRLMDDRSWNAEDENERQMALYPQLSKLLKKARRYSYLIEGRDRLRLTDQRFLLDNLLLWDDLWNDLQLNLPPDEFDEFVALLEARSAGPTLTDTDDGLLMCLDEAAGAWGNEGLDAEPPDPTVAARHGLIHEGSVAFKGSPAEAVEFLRGIVEGRTQPPTLVPVPVAMRPSTVGEAKRFIRRSADSGKSAATAARATAKTRAFHDRSPNDRRGRSREDGAPPVIYVSFPRRRGTEWDRRKDDYGRE